MKQKCIFRNISFGRGLVLRTYKRVQIFKNQGYCGNAEMHWREVVFLSLETYKMNNPKSTSESLVVVGSQRFEIRSAMQGCH